MASIHQGHRQRLKEEFLAHPDSMPEHKLLELALFYSIPQRDTNVIAHELIERFGSLAGVLDAREEGLKEVSYVGDNTVTLLKVVKALSSRYLLSRTSMDELVGSTAEAARLLRPYFFGAQTERVCVLCLDGKGKSLGVRQVAEGNVNATEITARKVAEAALARNASSVILAHNHTSGIALPSDEDKLTTRYLAKALLAVGVVLADHMIFVDDDMVSMKASGFDFRG